MLAPQDLSVPGVLTCRLVTVPEWIAFTLDTSSAVIKALTWLKGFIP